MECSSVRQLEDFLKLTTGRVADFYFEVELESFTPSVMKTVTETTIQISSVAETFSMLTDGWESFTQRIHVTNLQYLSEPTANFCLYRTYRPHR